MSATASSTCPDPALDPMTSPRGVLARQSSPSGPLRSPPRRPAQGWMDEYWTAVVTLPFIAACIPGYPVERFRDAIQALHGLPDWAVQLVWAAALYTMGTRLVKVVPHLIPLGFGPRVSLPALPGSTRN